jgi:Glyoxalase-like domain
MAMTSRISHTSVEAHNAYEQSVWWCQVVGFADDPQDPNRPGDEQCMIFSPDGRTRVLFIEVPDDKVVKNRVHFDLSSTDRTRDEEVERLLQLVPPSSPTIATRTAAAGSRWPIRRATSSASCAATPNVRTRTPTWSCDAIATARRQGTCAGSTPTHTVMRISPDQPDSYPGEHPQNSTTEHRRRTSSGVDERRAQIVMSFA